MATKELQTVQLAGGPKWAPNAAPQDQDLSGHFASMTAMFNRREIVACGPLESGQGFYVYQMPNVDEVTNTVQVDYGMKNQVLSVVEILPRHIVIDGSAANLKGKTLVKLDYLPGPAYVADKPADQQDPALLHPHVEYVGSVAQFGGMYLGGPVDPTTGRGCYILIVDDVADAQTFMDNDPAIKSGFFYSKHDEVDASTDTASKGVNDRLSFLWRVLV